MEQSMGTMICVLVLIAGLAEAAGGAAPAFLQLSELRGAGGQAGR